MKQRAFFYPVLMVCAVLLILLTVPVAGAWRVWRQEGLNRTLIAALRRNDTQRAIQMIEQGADADAQAVPDAVSFQQTLWSFLWGGRGTVRASGPTPLQTLFADEEYMQHLSKRQEPVEVVQELVARGAYVCVIDSLGFP